MNSETPETNFLGDGSTVAALVEARTLTRATNVINNYQQLHLIGWFAVMFQDAVDIKTVVDFDNHVVRYTCRFPELPKLKARKGKTKKKVKIKKEDHTEQYAAKVMNLGVWVRFLLGPDWSVAFGDYTSAGVVPVPRASRQVEKLKQALKEGYPKFDPANRGLKYGREE